MASLGISATIQRACSSQHIAKKQSPQSRTLGIKQAVNVTVPIVETEGLKLSEEPEKSPLPSACDSYNVVDPFSRRFSDEKWKNGTWDLNMFVKNGRMDWDSVIVAG